MKLFFFFFQAEDGIRDGRVTGVQTCALPIYSVGTMLARHRARVARYGAAARSFADFASYQAWQRELHRRTAEYRRAQGLTLVDRKSTRLNSSHPSISYAVFCLKKKKNNECLA